MSQNDIIIVGGGHAGAQAAIMLRQFGFKGSVTVISDEPELPYERPPLSKEYLAGDKPFEKLLLRPATFWGEQKVNFLLRKCVTAVDAKQKTVSLATGEALNFTHLIWAAGGSPRKLTCEGSDLKGIHYVRTRADAVGMMAELDNIKNAAVIGGGYVGLEAAAVLAKLGKLVTVIEAMDRVLQRVAGPTLSEFFEAEHRAHGVDIHTGEMVAGIIGENGRATGVRLASGETVAADFVVVGIGINLSVEPLVAAGAKAENGIIVDEYCRTSLPDIYAIGDCAAHLNGFAEGSMIRLESVQNANDQAITAAKAITGTLEPYRSTPWFWSNQYDLRLQTVGISSGFDDCVVRGDPATRSFSIVYLRKGKVVALDCINNVRDYSHGRKLVESGATPDRDRLADASIQLKALVT